MKAKSIQGRSYQETKRLFNESMLDGFRPTLAIVFTSLKEDWQLIQELLNENKIALFGTSSNGEFIGEQYEIGSTAMLLLDMPAAYFKLEMEDVDDTNTAEVARGIGESGLATFTNPGFIISGSSTSIRAEEIIHGLVDACGIEVNIVGGNSSSDSMQGGFLFNNTRRSDKGILALILDQDKIRMEGEAISGWKPMGTEKTITACEGNWIKTLDHKPALGMLLKYMGVEIDFTDEIDLYNKIGSIYPVQIQGDDGTARIIPPLFFNEEEGSFMLAAGPVQKGAKVKFSLPPDLDVVDAVVNTARQLKEQSLNEADALIIFSCIGRLNTLGPFINDEIKGLTDVWEIPSIGFFTFGEYGRAKNGLPTFHGTTVSWVALKEN
ncbi:MAG: FIST C-terminal domain-containing protein [Lewinellaceae bacterium]|nr:FIST C-terminal domain-containing protein [Lewinellaceae bacterium]